MSSENRPCPLCGEEIKAIAVMCRYCGSMLGEAPPGTPVPQGTQPGQTSPAWSQTSAHIPPSTEIREYRIERLLGEGGMGEVYLAEHTYTRQKVAIKAVSPLLMRDENVRKRFLEEGRVMATLDHPNVVTLHNFFEEAGRFFLVMQYVEGDALEALLERERKAGRTLSVARVLELASGILRGLAHGHTREPPVVHRDVKPANILIDKAGRPVVTDFGIAKVLGREKMTRTRGVVGTYEYMSPEQVTGDPVSPASDVYSTGIMLYRMLSGAVPYPQTSDTGIEVMDGHRQGTPPAIHALRPDCPEAVARWVERALAKEPCDRYADAATMLEQAPGASSADTDRPPRRTARGPRPKIPRWAIGLAGLAVIGLIAHGLGLFDHTPVPSPQGQEVAVGPEENLDEGKDRAGAVGATGAPVVQREVAPLPAEDPEASPIAPRPSPVSHERAAPPTPPPASIELIVTAVDPRANLRVPGRAWLDARPLGRTPATIKTTPGSHHVRVLANDGQTFETTINLAGAGTTTVEATFGPPETVGPGMTAQYVATAVSEEARHKEMGEGDVAIRALVSCTFSDARGTLPAGVVQIRCTTSDPKWTFQGEGSPPVPVTKREIKSMEPDCEFLEEPDCFSVSVPYADGCYRLSTQGWSRLPRCDLSEAALARRGPASGELFLEASPREFEDGEIGDAGGAGLRRETRKFSGRNVDVFCQDVSTCGGERNCYNTALGVVHFVSDWCGNGSRETSLISLRWHSE